jgi:hypothetical protein
MPIIITALAVTFAAFVVWLTIRLINRRERWARRLLIGIIAGAPVLYVLSLGPTVYITTRQQVSAEINESIATFYAPLVWIAEHGPAPIHDALWWYSELWWPKERLVDDPAD